MQRCGVHRWGAQASALPRGAQASALPRRAQAAPDPYFSAGDKRPIVLYDGVCNMCNGGVNFTLDNDSQGRVRFAALQSSVGRELLESCGRSPDDISSIVLVDEHDAYIKSEAVLRIGQLLDGPLPLLSLLAFPVPTLIRDPLYDLIADNRYTVFGMTDACRLSNDGFSDRFLS